MRESMHIVCIRLVSNEKLSLLEGMIHVPLLPHIGPGFPASCVFSLHTALFMQSVALAYNRCFRSIFRISRSIAIYDGFLTCRRSNTLSVFSITPGAAAARFATCSTASS